MSTESDQHQSILQLVSASPVAAASNDREGWLSLFSERAWIEDPAGSKRFKADDPERSLRDFYNIFIDGNEIALEIDDDYVLDREVLRDGEIVIGMPHGEPLRVPAYLHYQVDGNGKICGLRAHWQLVSAVWAALGRAGGAGYLLDLTRRVKAAVGLRGVNGLLSTTGFAPPIHRITVNRLKIFLHGGRYFEATMLFSGLDSGLIRVSGSGWSFSVAPNYLTTGELRLVDVDKLVTAGQYVVARVSLLLKGVRESGVVIVTFNRPGLRIKRLEIFLKSR